MPPMTWRKNQGVSPIRVMRNETAASRPADQWTQHRQPRDLGIFLRITERRGVFGPAVETRHGLAQLGSKLEQGFIQGHVEVSGARAGVEQQPGFSSRS